MSSQEGVNALGSSDGWAGILRDPRVQNLAADMRLLWVPGLAMLVLQAGAWIFTSNETYTTIFGQVLQSTHRQSRQYFALGTVFPALALGVLAALRSRRIGRLAEAATTSLGFYGLLAALRYLLGLGLAPLLVGAILPAFMLGAVFFSSARPPSKESSEPGRISLVVPVILGLAWVCSSRLLWWHSYEEWVGTSRAAVLATAGAAVLIVWNLTGSRLPGAQRHSTLRLASGAAAVAFLALLAFRTPHLFRESWAPNTLSFHHWGMYVGEAELIREGGHLLWDAPAPYGFLSILTLAQWPTASVWQALYQVNSLSNAGVSILLFFLFRARKQGVANYVFALAFSGSVVFFAQGYFNRFISAQTYPSIGGFRYLWCYALIVILLLDYNGGAPQSRARRIAIRTMGNAAWVLGVLWSCESAACCTGIWLPAYAIIVIGDSMAPNNACQSPSPSIATWLALPAAFLAISVAIVHLSYFVTLGHGPDWYTFFETAIRFAAGQKVGTSADPRGPILALLLVFLAVSAAAVFLLTSVPRRARGLVAAAWAFLWTTASYPLAHSGPVHLSGAMGPLVGVAAALILYLATQTSEGISSRLFKAAIAPVLIVYLAIPFGHPKELWDLNTIRAKFYEPEIERLLPDAPPAAAQLLATARIAVNDPVLFIDSKRIPLGVHTAHDGLATVRVASHPGWLPLKPFTYQAEVLGPERVKLYLARFTARSHLGGYLLLEREMKPKVPWLFEHLAATHRMRAIGSNSDYELLWFEPLSFGNVVPEDHEEPTNG